MEAYRSKSIFRDRPNGEITDMQSACSPVHQDVCKPRMYDREIPRYLDLFNEFTLRNIEVSIVTSNGPTRELMAYW